MGRRQTEVVGKYSIDKVNSKGRQREMQTTSCGLPLRRQAVSWMEGRAKVHDKTAYKAMEKWRQHFAVEATAGDEVRAMPVWKDVHWAFVGSLIKGFSFSLG